MLHYTVKQHGTSSHMHHGVTGFSPPQRTKRALIQTKRKTAMGVTFSTNSLQKMSGHNKFNKMAVYAAVTCGMIRDHPGMLRLVGLYCVPTDFCMGRKESERGWILCGKKKNALLGN